MTFTIIFLQFYSLGQQDLRQFSYGQDHISEKLILEITKVNIHSLVIYTTKMSKTHFTLLVNAQDIFQL